MIEGPLPGCLALGTSGWLASSWTDAREVGLRRFSQRPVGHTEISPVEELQAEMAVSPLKPRHGSVAPLQRRPVGVSRDKGLLREADAIAMIRKANGIGRERIRTPDVGETVQTRYQRDLQYRNHMAALAKEIGESRVDEARRTDQQREQASEYRASAPATPLPVLRPGFRWCSYQKDYVPVRGSIFERPAAPQGRGADSRAAGLKPLV